MFHTRKTIRSSVLRFFHFLAAFAFGLALSASAVADVVTASLDADGVYREFSTSTGTTHYSLLTANCGPTKYTYSTTTGASDSYRLSLRLVPAGSTITAIEITPCAASYTGASSRIQAFHVTNGVTSALSSNYDLQSGAPVALTPSTFGGLSIVRATSTVLEVGVKVGVGTGGIKLSGLTARITYSPPPDIVAPTNVTATTISSAELALTWADNSSNETGFRIERSLNGTSSWTLITTAGANITSYRDKIVTADQKYYYRMQAVDATISKSSAYSNTASAVTYATVPAVPRNLWAAVSGSNTTLNWMRLSNNDDGTTIESSTDGTTFTEIGRTAAGASSFVTGAVGGAFYYRVRAFNVLGNSAYSNTASNVSAPANGPDMRVSIQGQQTAGGATSQTAAFTVNYSNVGTLLANNVYLTATVPEKSTFNVAASSPEWRCHNPGSEAIRLQGHIGSALRAFKVRYPNLQQVFVSSSMYAGYATSAAAVIEPMAYEGGFSVKAAIEAQIQQTRTGVIDPVTGDMDYRYGVAPWAAWGAYLWANSTTPNGQGLFYELADFASDQSHPSAQGKTKLVNLMLNQLLSAPYTAWIRTQEAAPITIVPVAQPAPSPAALLDMLPGQRYLGMEGGLYPNVSNEMPADHLAAGMQAASRIQPLDLTGQPSPTGTVLFISIGYSNTKQIFDTFMATASADPRIKPQVGTRASPAQLRILNGAMGGASAVSWLSPTYPNFDLVNTTITSWGFSESQVQAIWFNAANASISSAAPLTGTAAGTVCTFPLGAVSANAAGSTTFAIRTASSRAQPITFSVTALDDGTAGTDLAPSDNSASSTITVTP